VLYLLLKSAILNATGAFKIAAHKTGLNLWKNIYIMMTESQFMALAKKISTEVLHIKDKNI
jgi:hypothetical protein